MWDDWGGWYDNAAPTKLDYRGLGIRTPLIIISPYAKQAHVSHTRYESGSILKWVEQVFDLLPINPTGTCNGYYQNYYSNAGPPGGYTDCRANSIDDAFNFGQSPLTFTTINAPKGASYFIGAANDTTAPDNE